MASWAAKDAKRVDELTASIEELERRLADQLPRKIVEQPVEDAEEATAALRLKAKERRERVAIETAKSATLDPRLVEKFSKKFLYPEKALRSLIENRMREGKTREQALKEIEEEHCHK